MRRVARWMLAAVAVMALVPGCTDGDEDAERDFCEFLGAGPGDGRRWIDSIVFLDVTLDQDRTAELRRVVESHRDVAWSEWVDQDDAYEEFLEMFAYSDELIAAVSASQLPASVRVSLSGPADSFVSEFEAEPVVYQVRQMPGAGDSFLDRHIRPLTLGGSAQSVPDGPHRSANQQPYTAPDSLRSAMEVLSESWSRPVHAETVPDEVVQAAREVAAFHDTRCSADD